MNLEQLNPAACRTYLLTQDKEAVLIDPVVDHVSDYLKLLKERSLRLTHIVDTHTHADHISGGPALRDATEAEYVMHAQAPAKCVSTRVKQGDTLTLAGKTATVLETPGHTRDSISLLFDDMLFTGDFLFLEDAGAGRDDLPGGDAGAHWESLQKINSLNGDTMVYPAHEYRDRVPSQLDNQRATNPHIEKAAEGKLAFVTYIDELKLGPADWMKDVLAANYKCATDPNAAWIPADLPACEVKGTLNPNAADIDVSTLAVNQLAGITDDTLLLDVREQDELIGQLPTIDGAVNIPVGSLTHQLDKLADYKDKPVISICRSGARATTAAQILITAGFSNVKVLNGGMIEYHSQM